MNRFHALVLVCWLAGLTSAQACSVPVFNYALTHWEADDHELELPPGSPDATGFEALIAGLHANLHPGAIAEGRCTVRLPDGRPWFTGQVDAAAIARLAGSPARRELARRLCGGDSVVWLVVGDGAGTKAGSLLPRLAELARLIELPAAEPDDPQAAEQQRLAGPALRIAFSVLEVTATDPAESGLVAQIAALAGGALPDGGVAVAVFGRGRALQPIPLRSLSRAAIDDTTISLCSACSCVVKAANPGTDLLIAWNWEEALERAMAERLRAGPPETLLPPVVETPAARIPVVRVCLGLVVLGLAPSAAGALVRRRRRPPAGSTV